MSETSKPTREPLTWDSVRILERAGSYGSAQIAARILRDRERKAQRPHRRWLRWVRGL